MTVQTTFAGGVNPWAIYNNMEVSKRKKGERLTIDVDEFIIRNERGELIEFESFQRYRDIFGKIKDGYSLRCSRCDLAKVVDSYQRYRRKTGWKFNTEVSWELGLIRFSKRVN